MRVCTTLLCLALTLGADMRKRDQAAWGIGRASPQRVPAAPAEQDDLDVVRKRCCDDLKWMYVNMLCCQRPAHEQRIGRLHDFLFDFLRWEELAKLPKYARYTELCKLLPEHDDGIHCERWMYWPTLDAKPEIEDGPNTRLSKLFHKGELMSPSMPGLLIRLKDDGMVKAVILPRGHLKSEIADYALNMQEIARDPSVRMMVRSGEEGLAEKLIANVKRTVEANPEWIRYFGDLRPNFKEEVWSNEAIQVRTEFRRSMDPTLSAFSILGSAVGYHVDYNVLDDAVTLQNLNRLEDVRKRVQDIAFVADRKLRVMDIGTIYRDNDTHAMFIRPSGGLYPFSSFIVATVRDAKDKPIWPEGMDERELTKRKAMCEDENHYFCQYWNNPFIGRVEGFSSAWWQTYEGVPEERAHNQKLDIIITCDPASKTKKKNDYTALLAQGVTQDGSRRYILDGVRDRIPFHEAPKTLVDFALKWQQVARKARTSFKFGIEQVAFVEYLQESMRTEMRRRGLSFEIKPLKHKNQSKEDRIRKLMPLYSAGAIFWPEKLEKTACDGTSYDLVDVYKDEFAKFPRASHDDLLDDHAYGEDLMPPTPMKSERAKAEAREYESPDMDRRVVTPTPDERPRYTGRPMAAGRNLAKLARQESEPQERPRYTGRFVPRRPGRT